MLIGARLVLSGLAVVMVAALWHRPAADHHVLVSRSRACPVAGAEDLCEAIAGLSVSFHQPILVSDRARVLPPGDTPGAIDPAITQANIDTTICRPGYARSVRPTYAVTGPLKRRMMAARHPGEPMADYELDHLIPISLGGSPLDMRDLWLQPRRGSANAGDKNVLAYVLWRLVCEDRLPLKKAQDAISSDWTKAYEIYATPANVAKYHLRHRDRVRD